MKVFPNACALSLLSFIFIIAVQCKAWEGKRNVTTAAVVTNLAYFHMLDCYATSNRSNPLKSLLNLNLDESLFAPAKKHADQCPKDRKISIRHNLTEVFFVSEIREDQLSAKSRQRFRDDSEKFSNADRMARVMHAAYYMEQSDLVFDKETVAEKVNVGVALDGTFSFGCDMTVCKEDNKNKGIVVCHFVRGVPKPKRMITKAEAERRRAIENEPTAGSELLIPSMSIFTIVLSFTFGWN